MGKYDKSKLAEPTRMTSWCLLKIANELAEANRLKRLELHYKLHPSPDISEFSIEKELEDQA